MHRGSAVQGGLARSERGPRRATPALFQAHWDTRVADGKNHQVFPLGGGRFALVTTQVRLVTEKQLRDMGLEVPAPELPWEPTQPARTIPQAERLSALHYWKEVLGGYEPKLADNMPHFLREFGPEGVREAIDQVAATHAKAHAPEKHKQLIRVFQQMRERRALGAREGSS